MAEESIKPPKRVGRPRLDLTDKQLEELEKLAGIACTMEEAAAWFEMSKDTLENRFKEQPERYAATWERGKNAGKASLRRIQMSLAKRNAAMAIFLGKQWLGQRDVVVNEHAGSIEHRQREIDFTGASVEERTQLRAILARRAGEPASGTA